MISDVVHCTNEKERSNFTLSRVLLAFLVGSSGWDFPFLVRLKSTKISRSQPLEQFTVLNCRLLG